MARLAMFLVDLIAGVVVAAGVLITVAAIGGCIAWLWLEWTAGRR